MVHGILESFRGDLGGSMDVFLRVSKAFQRGSRRFEKASGGSQEHSKGVYGVSGCSRGIPGVSKDFYWLLESFRGDLCSFMGVLWCFFLRATFQECSRRYEKASWGFQEFQRRFKGYSGALMVPSSIPYVMH